MTNGVADASLQHGGPKVYGIVQRVGADRQQEVMAREWTASHLQDEMKYIREVSVSQTDRRIRGCSGGLVMKVSVFPPAGERFLGEGEGTHVWTIRRDATIHAEAHTGDQGTEGLVLFFYEIVKLNSRNGLSACPQAANAQRRSLESEVKIRTSAMESFDQMNSSLITANLSLQVTNSF